MAKALYWVNINIERQKLREQMGLDALIVLAINDGY